MYASFLVLFTRLASGAFYFAIPFFFENLIYYEFIKIDLLCKSRPLLWEQVY